jgi:DNA-binding transcriptional LysR family regulator
VRLPNGALFRWPFERDGRSIQIDVKGPITLDEASLTKTAALEGIGIGFLWEADVREDIASGRLVRVLQDWTPALSPLCLYYPGRRNPSAAFKAFIEMARAFDRE